MTCSTLINNLVSDSLKCTPEWNGEIPSSTVKSPSLDNFTDSTASQTPPPFSSPPQPPLPP